MRISYNSPVVLTFTILSTLVLSFSEYIIDLRPWFTIPGIFNFSSIKSYFTLFSYTMGHANWQHLFGNFTLILLVGPMLEEKFGSYNLLFMMLITALLSAVLHIMFFDHGALGASGIVFMFIILSSITSFKRGRIPLTFLLITILFLGKEVLDSFNNDQVSQFGHIAGGILGGALGFFFSGDRLKEMKPSEEQTHSEW